LLHNEAYVGRLYWNRAANGYDPALGRMSAGVGREWIEIPIPAIIDADTFDGVERAARDNSIYSPRRTESNTFLASLIRGGTMTCLRSPRTMWPDRRRSCPT
jgi:hypothetical protein